MAKPIPLKRGTTFSAKVKYTPTPGRPATLAGVDIKSQIRKGTSDTAELVAELVVALDGDNMGFTLTAPTGTAAWPAANLMWDIRFSNAGVVWYTETVEIAVAKEVTK